MKKLFDGFALAFNMMSIIPFFKIHHFFKGINGYSAMFYPIIGALFGTILFLLYTLLTPYLPQTYLHVLIFSLFILLTGGLHLDGLSDTIDGFFVSKERSLEVMKDSHVGGMGMIFTFVFLSLKLSAFIYIDMIYLIPILLLSRLNATLAIYFYRYISSGVGALIKEELEFKHIVFALFYSTVIVLYFTNLWFFIIAFGTLVILATFLTRRLGGLNGDNYGFIIEVSELLLLNLVMIKIV